MFGLKKLGRDQSARLHGMVSDRFKPKLERFSLKLRFPGRIRLWNRWGKKHPKRLMSYYLLFAGGILTLNVAVSFIGLSHEKNISDSLELTALSQNNPIEGMMAINRNREIIQNMVSDYAGAKLLLANRLDSLCALPKKSRADSIEISHLWNLLTNPTTNKAYESTTN